MDINITSISEILSLWGKFLGRLRKILWLRKLYSALKSERKIVLCVFE